MSQAVRIGNEYLTVDVSPLGAEMQGLKTRDGRDWLWNGDAQYWTGRSPVLFPIVGKAPDDHIEIDGRVYPMAQHGFARRTTFDLAASTPTMCRFELKASDVTRAVYPFDFLLAVEHAVDGTRLTVAAEVENHGETDMPFGIGFHPAFLWPLPGGEGKPHQVVLDNGAEPALSQLEGGFIPHTLMDSPFEGGRLTLRPDMFKADALIFPQGAGEGLTYGAEGGPQLHFTFENLPNLALWQKVGAPFLCVEPWHGMAARAGAGAELSARPSTTVLVAGEKARFAFTVEMPA
ncbi:aldose 1-epimerase family protein [Neorhizobium sp. NPDC001467]|uniref:aldose 1-epimerase family protein n=1 Tax=Neorhizobium sp. NPDC001467 TaxID=3390595 RepID=UPI003D07AE83